MYCSNCGKRVEGKFCIDCGTSTNKEISNKETSQKEEIVNNKSMSLKERSEKYISEYLHMSGINSKMTPIEYFRKAKPLKRIRVSCFGGTMVLLTFIAGPVGLLAGALFGIIPYVITLYIKNGIEASKEYECKYSNNVGEKLFDYLRVKNTCDHIELDQFSENKLRVKFNNQSYHKVIFDEKSSTYKVRPDGCTLKEALKNAGSAPVGLMYKNSKLVNPVLRAIVDDALLSI